MRRVAAATMIVVSLVVGGFVGFAAAVTKPYFGVYTVNQLLGGGGHLEASISVLDPPSKVDMQFDCGKPSGLDTVTDVFYSPVIPLRSGSFRFLGKAKLTKLTTVTENNAPVKKSFYTASVDVSGTFKAANDQYIGSVQLGGSPCQGTAYTAYRKAAPVPG
jgi:hypothetical protein